MKRKLGAQFTFVLTAIFLCGIVLSGLVLGQIAQRGAEVTVTSRAKILTETMNSIRDYTSSNINPLLQDQLPIESKFIRETVPAFAAREIFDRFRERPEYHSLFYKEATLNPTNLRDRADDFEKNIIWQFQRDRQLQQLSGYRTTIDGNLFYIARPLVVDQASCLQCHSRPSVAPRSLIASYGDKNGFGWKLNQVVSAQTVYVPADEIFAQSWRWMMLMMGIFSSIFAIAVLSIGRLLQRRVVSPLKKLTDIAEGISAGVMTTQQLAAFDTTDIVQVARRMDEPGQLARAFQEMAHEVSAREQNLTQTVIQRTAQLAASKEDAEQAKGKAEAANHAKSQFLSNMSHELRTPLNVILGFTQLMMRKQDLNPKQQEYLNTIAHSGEHLLALINDVLEMSKIEAGKIALNPTAFDLHSLLDPLYQMLEVRAKTKGLKLIFEINIDRPQFIYLDESKLRQILLNLLGNAIKFTDRGQVSLQINSIRTAGTDRLNLIFVVADTGVGIAAVEIAQLFEPFVQAQGGLNTSEGTGLGLSISRQFINLMGGEISVNSIVGIGTSFQFNLQTQSAIAPVLPAARIDQIIGLVDRQPQYRILIVEDKLENRQLLIELLAPIGFNLQMATNGQEAIDLAKSWFPHLIWMDIRMPGIDGYEAVKQIKAANLIPQPIIIALTGSVFESERTAALSMGFDDFIRKPFTTQLIFDKIAEHLGVRYRYAEDRIDDDLQPVQLNTQTGKLTPADLAFMPLDWIEQLHQAATRVNAKLILQSIDQIPADQIYLTTKLTELVNNFCFEEIIALTSAGKSGRTDD